MLPIQQIQPGKYQPRRHWNDEALDELAASIRAQGLIQPVVVRELGKNSYELIAGERRWRAAQRAQMGEIARAGQEGARGSRAGNGADREHPAPGPHPAGRGRCAEAPDRRFRPHPPAGRRCRRPLARLGIQSVAADRAAASIKKLLDDGKLDMGHARCLLTLPERDAESAGAGGGALGWSVRELEEAARRAQTAPKGKAKTAHPRDPEHRRPGTRTGRTLRHPGRAGPGPWRPRQAGDPLPQQRRTRRHPRQDPLTDSWPSWIPARMGLAGGLPMCSAHWRLPLSFARGYLLR